MIERLEELRALAARHGIPLGVADRIALRPREIARALGLSLRLVEGEIASGSLPSSRIGRAVVVPVVDVLAWLDRHRREARQDSGTLAERAAAVIRGASAV